MKKLTLDFAAGKIKTHNVSNDFQMAIRKKQYVSTVKQKETAVRMRHHLLKYFKYALPGFAQPFCQLYNSSFSCSHGEVGVNCLFIQSEN